MVDSFEKWYDNQLHYKKVDGTPQRGIDLKTGCVVFIGGGALLLREYLEHSEKIGRCVFIEDIRANAKGYGLLYQIQRKGR